MFLVFRFVDVADDVKYCNVFSMFLHLPATIVIVFLRLSIYIYKYIIDVVFDVLVNVAANVVVNMFVDGVMNNVAGVVVLLGYFG